MLDLKYKVNYCKEVQVSGHCEEWLSRVTLVIRRRAAADGGGPGLQKVSWVKFRSQLALYHEPFSVCDYSVVGKDSPLGGPRDSGLGAIPVQNTPDIS